MTLSNLDHERALLSALKARPVLLDELHTEQRDFSTGKYAFAFAAVKKLYEAGEEVNDMRLLDLGVPADTIVELDLPTVSSAKVYADSLRELARLRGIRTLVATVTDMLARGEKSEFILEGIANGAAEIAGSVGSVVHIREVIHDAIESIETRFQLLGGLAGLTSGYTGIDKLLLGFREGQLIVIAARPAIGKTALALSMCAKMARKGICVGFIELEMSRAEIAERLLSLEGRFDLRTVQTGQVNFGRVTQGAEMLYAREIWLDDSPRLTITEVQSTARNMVRRGAQVVFVDQLTLIEAGREEAGMYERTGAAALGLKTLARTCGVPVIALHQLNREAEGVEPSLAHLAQSGQIEQHADVVMLLHRERNHKDESRHGDPIESKLTVAKARGSDTGVVNMMFVPQYVTFEEEAR